MTEYIWNITYSFLQNDIAILQVETDFVFNENVKKVDLWLSAFGMNSSYPEYYTMLRQSGNKYHCFVASCIYKLVFFG